MGVSYLEVAFGKVDQRLLCDRAGGAAGADAGRVMDSTAWTVVAAPDEKKLAAIVGSAIEIAPAERIIPFGSAARGDMVEDSDLDLLVVADTRHGRAVARRIRAARLRRSAALDITIATSTEVEANRHDACCIIHDALREGRVLYDVADAPPLDTE